VNVPNLRIRVLQRVDQVSEFWDWLTMPGRRMVAVDTETTGLDWWSPTFRVRIIQFGDTEGGWAIPFDGWPALIGQALEECSRRRIRMVFHNVPFDSLALRAGAGIELDWTCVEDTFVLQKLGGHTDQHAGLKECAMREFGPWAGAGERVLHRGMKEQGWTWADVPLGWKPYPLYGVVDTCVTAALWEIWDASGRRKRWAADHDLELNTIRITGQMSWRGLPTDGVYLWGQIQAHEAEEADVKAKLAALGITNPAQNGQLAVLLQKDGVTLNYVTEKGALKLDDDILKHIPHPAAQLTRKYRQVHRWLVAYLRPIFSGAGGVQGRGLVHPGIKPFEARTGRMSVENPPLQQLPANDPVIRRGIVARSEDEDFVSADYGQIELRLWASLTADTAMIEALKTADATGDDFFVGVGRTVYGEPDFQKADKRRGLLKATTYTKLFGGGIETAAVQAGVDVYGLVPTWRRLEQEYPSLKDQGASLITSETDEHGAVVHKSVSPFGREFRVTDPVLRRKLPNYAVQGTATIALKKALTRLEAAGFGDLMLLPVHDEVCFSIPKTETADAMAEIAAVMDTVVTEEEFGIAVRAEPSKGDNWAEAKG
jgi:DNA polymerase I